MTKFRRYRSSIHHQSLPAPLSICRVSRQRAGWMPTIHERLCVLAEYRRVSVRKAKKLRHKLTCSWVRLQRQVWPTMTSRFLCVRRIRRGSVHAVLQRDQNPVDWQPQGERWHKRTITLRQTCSTYWVVDGLMAWHGLPQSIYRFHGPSLSHVEHVQSSIF